MAAASIIASVITGGANSHQTVAEELNAYATDFVSQGVVGAISAGPPATGPFGITQDVSPDMGVTILPGVAYVAGTPATQDAQIIRARMTSSYTSYTISSNSSGTTKYDWIYLDLNATNATTPDAAADNVINLYTSRSSSNSADNGSPPTYGLLLAVVTVANGASSITNSNISDQRTNVTLGGAAGGKVTSAALSNPYKFSYFRLSAFSLNSTAVIFPMDTKVFDTSNNYNTTTGLFTAPIAGFYQFNGAVSATTVPSSAYFWGAFWKNGAELERFSRIVGNSSNGEIQANGSTLLQLAANDTVGLSYGIQNTENAEVGAQAQNCFKGFLVSAT